MADPTPDNLASKQDEPLFTAISRKDTDFQSAYKRAAATVAQFIQHVQRGGDAIFSAKLRFRDPDESERLGENRYAFIWLTGVQYNATERLFSGIFFELPPEFQKWHRVGERLAFDPEDLFDWMVLTPDGRLFGGYTLRVSRSKLPESERAEHDRYIGVTAYEPEAEYADGQNGILLTGRTRWIFGVMPLDFTATECGFYNGLGGASNAVSAEEHHYVLFGKDGDGVYFEFDDQINGGIDQIAGVQVAESSVLFSLTDGKTITVRKQMNDAKWSEFVTGIKNAFPPAIVAGA